MLVFVKLLLLVACVNAVGVDVTTEYGRIHGKEEIDPGVTVSRLRGKSRCGVQVARYNQKL